MKKKELIAILKSRIETSESIANKYAAAAGFADATDIEKTDESRALCYLAEAYADKICLKMLTDDIFFKQMKTIYLTEGETTNEEASAKV